MKKLSIITTVYKKGNDAVYQLNRLVNFVNNRKINSEIIVVIDGKVNNDYELITSYIKRKKLEKLIKVYSYFVNRGKGFAQRFGYSKSKGDVVMFVDADKDIRMNSIYVAYNTFITSEKYIDAVYPSKLHKESDLDGTNFFRKFLSFGLRKITFFLLGSNPVIDDVSCGLKIFKRSALKLFINELFVNRFATDSEVYFWVNKLGLRVKIVPFFMNMPKNSTSVNTLDILKVFFDIIIVAIKLRFNSLVRGNRVGYLQNSQPIV